ncbi:MAG: serine hydroxymethyltransferase [Patescibacteria group bacterium]|jgi:glycine hydroxymethyltransferase
MTKSKIPRLIKQEIERQKNGLVMIASENYCPQNILNAMGTPLSNKYSEGYPGKRYYSGNKYIDEIESEAQKSCLKVFGLKADDWHANVQPHSGSSANLACYLGLLQPGDKIMAMDLSAGGHLTHGSPVNFSGQLFKFIPYGVAKKTEQLDYDAIARLAKKERPKMIVCGATAYPRLIDFKKFRQIADSCNALLLADIAHIAGLIAAKEHPSPFPYADIVTSTTHKTLGGPRSAFIICRAAWAKAIDKAVFPGLQGGPLENIIAAKALCFERALSKNFNSIQKQTVANAKALAQTLKNSGLRLVSGGTDNHLLLLDLRSADLTGKIAADALERAEIYANANMIPYDPAKPLNPSGLRLGTAALTTRGMKEKEIRLIGLWIAEIIKWPNNEKLTARIKKEVRQLTKKFPIY